VRVSRYKVRGRCWPWIEVNADPVAIGAPGIQRDLRAKVQVAGGLCGEQELAYHVEYRNWRVTANAEAPGLDPSTFAWSVNGVPIPANQASAVPIPVKAYDPRPPRKPRHNANATIQVEEAASLLRFVTDSADGNYYLDVGVQTMVGPTASSTSSGSQVEITGIVCPELDEADKQCLDRYERETDKLTRDWDHWVDPSDPLIKIVDRSGVERERILGAIGAARQLAALGQPEGPEIASRLADALHVKPEVILRR
jgi:hypothetical protein